MLVCKHCTDILHYLPQPLAVLSTDIDECNGTNPCAPNGNCVNTNGSFTCNCSSGYELDTGGQNCSGTFIILFHYFMLGVNIE